MMTRWKEKKKLKEKKSFIDEDLEIKIQANVSFTATTRTIHVTNSFFTSLLISVFTSLMFSFHRCFHFTEILTSLLTSNCESKKSNTICTNLYHLHRLHSWEHEFLKKRNIVTITFYAIVSRLVSILHQRFQNRRHFFDVHTSSTRIDYNVYSIKCQFSSSQAIRRRVLKIALWRLESTSQTVINLIMLAKRCFAKWHFQIRILWECFK